MNDVSLKWRRVLVICFGMKKDSEKLDQLDPEDLETFKKIIASSSSIKEALMKMGYGSVGANYNTFKYRAQKYGIDISHFDTSTLDGFITNADPKSIRNSISDEELTQKCVSSITISETLRRLGLSINSRANRKWLKSKIEKLNIDTSHWKGQKHMEGKTRTYVSKIPLEEILVENHYISTGALKNRLKKEGLLKDVCYSCGINEWLGQKLSLQLDHINGTNTDNRIENLRLLCPNCHSLTPTFCRRKSSLHKEEVIDENSIDLKSKFFRKEKITIKDRKKKCLSCDSVIYFRSTRCRPCASKISFNQKILWPSDSELIKELSKISFTALAKRLGVSDNAIRKHLKLRNIFDKVKSPFRHKK